MTFLAGSQGFASADQLFEHLAELRRYSEALEWRIAEVEAALGFERETRTKFTDRNRWTGKVRRIRTRKPL